MRYRHFMVRLFAALFAGICITAASVGSRAETKPDLSSLGSEYLLSDNQQILPISSGYVVISTDSVSSTNVVFVDQSGQLLDDNIYPFWFTYQKAVLCGDSLYLVGQAPGKNNTVQISWLDLPSKKFNTNYIPNVNYDLSRGFYAEPGGKLYLVTTATDTVPNSASPFYLYRFPAESKEPNLIGTPAPDYVPGGSSSVPPSSSPSSQESSGSSVPSSSSQPGSSLPSTPSTPSSSSSSPTPPKAAPYYFTGAVTVNELQKQLDAEGRGAAVRITAADGTPVVSGSVGTGAVIEVLVNGVVESRVTAVVPGDLTGSGTLTPRDSALIYEYCIGRQNLSGYYLDAADVNRDGKVDTSDMLQIKSKIS